MTFEEDLTKRRIDITAFAAGDPARYAEWKAMYGQMHPNSFYVSVKMVLNDVRRKFWLAEAAKPVVTATDAPAKPVTRRASIPGTGAAKPETKPLVVAPMPEPTENQKQLQPRAKGEPLYPEQLRLKQKYLTHLNLRYRLQINLLQKKCPKRHGLGRLSADQHQLLKIQIPQPPIRNRLPRIIPMQRYPFIPILIRRQRLLNHRGSPGI